MTLILKTLDAEWHCGYAECHYVECQNTGCSGTKRDMHHWASMESTKAIGEIASQITFNMLAAFTEQFSLHYSNGITYCWLNVSDLGSYSQQLHFLPNL